MEYIRLSFPNVKLDDPQFSMAAHRKAMLDFIVLLARMELDNGWIEQQNLEMIKQVIACQLEYIVYGRVSQIVFYTSHAMDHMPPMVIEPWFNVNNEPLIFGDHVDYDIEYLSTGTDSDDSDDDGDHG